MVNPVPIGYRKTFRMRQPVPRARHYTVAIPAEVIERQALINSITVEQFLKDFVVVAEYDNFEGVHYTFKRAANGDPHTED